MEAILFLLLLPYVALIIYFSIRLYIPKQYSAADTIDTDGRIAIVVACKNEAENLPALLESIEKQHSMPKEIIFVDDNSTDNTYSILQSFAVKMPNVQVLKSSGQGKKAALLEGVTQSSCKYILFTDADCILPEEFCLKAKIFLTTHDTDMLLGGVKLHYKDKNDATAEREKTTNPFRAFEILDFCSLQAVTAGAAMMGKPIMCNGANMIVRRDVYLQNVSGIRSDIPSGDDMFMLHNIKASKGKICYLFTPEQIISTLGNDAPLDFFTQRKRWIGKLPAYTDKFTIVTATITAVTNIMLASIYTATLFAHNLWILSIMAYIIKLAIDCFALIPYLRIINRRNLLYYMPLMSIFYPFYVTFTGIVSVIGFIIKNNKPTKIRMSK